METIHFPDDPRPPWLVHPVLALGNFDGLHRGHLKIIERVKRGAAEHGGTPMAMTFDPHPPRVVRPDKAPPLLMTKAQRLEALDRAGIACVAVVRFTPELSHWDPGDVRAHGAGRLAACLGSVGRRQFSVRPRAQRQFQLLRTLGQRYGFRADKIDPVRYKDFVVSSTRIRRLVAEGRMDEAGALLGHPYFIDGDVVEGTRRGREIGFPTANLRRRTSCSRRTASMRPTMTIDGIVHAGYDQYRRHDRHSAIPNADHRDASCCGFAGDLYGRRVRLASCSGCATSGSSRTWTRCGRRSKPTAAAPSDLFSADCRCSRGRNDIRIPGLGAAQCRSGGGRSHAREQAARYVGDQPSAARSANASLKRLVRT